MVPIAKGLPPSKDLTWWLLPLGLMTLGEEAMPWMGSQRPGSPKEGWGPLWVTSWGWGREP